MVSIYSIEYLIRRVIGECTVAIVMLSEVSKRFTPEVFVVSSGEIAIVFKGALERAGKNLLTYFTPPRGTNIGWVEANK